MLAENREMHAFSSFLGHVPLISRLDRRLPGVHAHNLKHTTAFEAHGVGLDLCGHAFDLLTAGARWRCSICRYGRLRRRSPIRHCRAESLRCASWHVVHESSMALDRIWLESGVVGDGVGQMGLSPVFALPSLGNCHPAVCVAMTCHILARHMASLIISQTSSTMLPHSAF
jgi:hypothetical protein